MKQITLFTYFIVQILYHLQLCNDYQFEIINESFAKVYLGNPEQELKLFIDPNSLVSALFDHKCLKCGSSQKYSQASNTLIKSHIFYSLKTIFGSYDGIIVNEQITFSTRKKMSMYFLLVNDTNAIGVDFDGILGLGQSSNQLQAFQSLSLITQINKQFNKESIYTIERNKYISFGVEDTSPSSSESNAIEILMESTNMDYPTMNTHFKGISSFNKLDMTSNPHLFMDISGAVSFTFWYNDSMPHVIFPSQEMQYFPNYLDYMIEDSSQLKEIKDKGDNIIFSYNGKYNLDEYVSALIIQNNFFKYTSSNDTKRETVLNIAFTTSSNYSFFTLNQLKSNKLVFDYTKNSILLYDCYGCHYNGESSFWVFSSIFVISGGAITILLILLSFRVYHLNGDENRNLLKSYTIII